MAQRLTVVPRISADERTLAVVQWDGCPESDLLARLTAAVTEWVDTTEDGQTAWHNSSQDFNIGDLSHWIEKVPKTPAQLAAHTLRGMPPHSITPILEKYNIRDLEITIFHDISDCTNWTYDTALVNGHALSD